MSEGGRIMFASILLFKCVIMHLTQKKGGVGARKEDSRARPAMLPLQASLPPTRGRVTASDIGEAMVELPP